MSDPRPQSDGHRLTDAQRDAIERTDLSMAVTSGAGCGKTFVLARRFLRALEGLGDGDAVSRVVAVTFTEKATLEMRNRVAGLIRTRLSETSDPQRRELLAQWLGRMPAARISTIHGFCASLLRRYALDAGVDPGFAVLAEEFVQRRMLAEACEQEMLADLGRDDSVAARLLDRCEPPELLSWLEQLIAQRWRWDRAHYADPQETLARWRRLLSEIRDRKWAELDRDAIRRRMDELAAIPCDNPADKLAERLRDVLAATAILLEGPNEPTIQRMDDIYKRGRGGSAKAWGSKETVAAVKDGVERLGAPLKQAAQYIRTLNETDAETAAMLAELTALAEAADRRYRRAKFAAGVLDFNDLLIRTRDLLRDRPGVRTRVAGEIDALLIDEFQDTDSLQRELLWLAIGAEGISAPPGKLFFVGDAKQSIYRFRGAEVDVFEAARDAMAPEHRRALDLSFRTHRDGVALVNALFAPIMGRAYEPLSAHRDCRPAEPAAELILVDTDPQALAPQRRRAEARVIAQRVAELLDGPPSVWDDHAGQWRKARPGDCAILLGHLTEVGEYETALHDAGVPSYVAAGAGLFRQQEVFDLINALRAIDNPLDDVSLVGLLRGAMVGLDDNVLAWLAQTTKPPLGAGLRSTDLAERLTDAQRQRLRWCADWLDELSACKDQLPLPELIERLLAATDFEAALLTQYRGLRKAGNVRRVAALARSAEAQGQTLRQFTDELAELTVQQVRAEQAAGETHSRDAVEIMTVHKAKGLEFPAVFVAEIDRAPLPARDRLLIREPFGLTLRPVEEGVEPGGADLAARAIEADAERSEQLRAFYVAVTRHRDFLCLSAAPSFTRDGRVRGSDSPLHRLDEHFGVIDAMERGRLDLPGGARLRLRRREAPAPQRRPGASTLEPWCEQAPTPVELAERMSRPVGPAPEPPPHLAPATGRGLLRLSPTALAELEHCPRSYRWSRLLGVPQVRQAGAPASAGGADETLAPTEMGTLIHLAMEMLDFDDPQPAGALIPAAAEALGYDVDAAELVEQFKPMLRRFRGSELFARIAAADRRLAELPLVMHVEGAEMTGVIDLVIHGPAGWEIIDYKSDRIAAEQAPAHSRRYRLQMQIYALAAARKLHVAQAPPVTLHYLRPGVSDRLDPGDLDAGVIAARVAELTALLRECLRTDRWPGRDDDACARCRHERLCRR